MMGEYIGPYAPNKYGDWKPYRLTLFQSWRSEVPQLWCQQSWVLLETLGDNPFPCFCSFWRLPASLGPRPPPPCLRPAVRHLQAALWLRLLPLSLHCPLSLCFCGRLPVSDSDPVASLLWRLLWWRWACQANPGESAHLNTLNHICRVSSPCKVTYSQVPGIRIWTRFGGQGHYSVEHSGK